MEAGHAGGLAAVPEALFPNGLWRGRATYDQAVGGAWVLQSLGGLTPCPWVLVLLCSQMVAVNSSSPMAACSGPWDTRGMEESVTASDGNAESLYMQGTGQPGALLGQSWREGWPPPGSPGWAQGTFPGALLQPHS